MCYVRTVVLAAAIAWAKAADWPAFRGLNSAGVAETTGLPLEFGPSRNVVWKTALPPGASSPTIAGERVFLTAYEGRSALTIALDRKSGKILWRRAVERGREEALHKLNNPASPTAASDGKSIFVFFGDFGLVSYGLDGNERWRLPLGPFQNLHGMASSPLLLGDRLYMLCDQDRPSFLIAVHKDTGKVLWKIERPEAVHGFTTPVVFRPRGGAPQLIIPGSYFLAAYSPETGEKLWWARGLTWQIKTTAVVDDETVYATGWAPGADAGERKELPPFEEALAEGDADGDNKLAPAEVPPRLRHTGSWTAIDLNRDGFLDARDWSFYRARRASHNVTMAVRPGNARGDLTNSHVVWTNERSVPQVSSPLLYRGALYTAKDGGIFTALDAATGEIKKQARLTGAIDAYYSSPVAADGRIYVISENGKASVIRAGAEWELLQVNDLEDRVYATPALADGRIYVRTMSALYCFGEN